MYDLVQACSPGPYLELFARGKREQWATWGNQANDDYVPTWRTYANHSQAERPQDDRRQAELIPG